MSFENITNNPMIEMANLKKKPNIFSTENKDKIFEILKINKSNLFTKQNINTLIKMVSNKNKPKMKILLKNIEKIKNNGLNKKNKNIVNELLKIKELIVREKEKHIQLLEKLNKNRGFNVNSVNIIREPLTTNNRVNISMKYANEYIIYLIPIEKLREMIKNLEYKKDTRGGDGMRSKFYLFDLKKFEPYIFPLIKIKNDDDITFPTTPSKLKVLYT